MSDVKIQAYKKEAVGDVTAFVAIGSRVVGCYLAPLPDPVRPNLTFFFGGGKIVKADLVMGLFPREDGGYASMPTVVFKTSEELDALRVGLRERGAPELFRLDAD
jgi:hypothetical protein